MSVFADTPSAVSNAESIHEAAGTQPDGDVSLLTPHPSDVATPDANSNDEAGDQVSNAVGFV